MMIVCHGAAVCSRKVLDRSPSIDEPGYMKWDLVLVLLAAWVICCLGVIKGIKSSGKVDVEHNHASSGSKNSIK